LFVYHPNTTHPPRTIKIVPLKRESVEEENFKIPTSQSELLDGILYHAMIRQGQLKNNKTKPIFIKFLNGRPATFSLGFTIGSALSV
jgi:hypothetical protein